MTRDTIGLVATRLSCWCQFLFAAVPNLFLSDALLRTSGNPPTHRKTQRAIPMRQSKAEATLELMRRIGEQEASLRKMLTPNAALWHGRAA